MGEELGLRVFDLENSCEEYCTPLFIFQLGLFFFLPPIILTLSSKCEEEVHTVVCS